MHYNFDKQLARNVFVSSIINQRTWWRQELTNRFQDYDWRLHKCSILFLSPLHYSYSKYCLITRLPNIVSLTSVTLHQILPHYTHSKYYLIVPTLNIVSLPLLRTLYQILYLHVKWKFYYLKLTDLAHFSHQLLF